VSPASKRHLRHVTPGALTPDTQQFGCDILPNHIRSSLSHPPGILPSPGQVATQGHAPSTSASAPAADAAEATASEPVASAVTTTTSDEGATTLGHDAPLHSSTAQEQASAIEAAMDLPTLDAGLPHPQYSYSLQEMTRFKRGRQAEQALAAGQPLSYTLRAYGLVCQSHEVVQQ
jgi:hypothetical protein